MIILDSMQHPSQPVARRIPPPAWKGPLKHPSRHAHPAPQPTPVNGDPSRISPLTPSTTRPRSAVFRACAPRGPSQPREPHQTRGSTPRTTVGLLGFRLEDVVEDGPHPVNRLFPLSRGGALLTRAGGSSFSTSSSKNPKVVPSPELTLFFLNCPGPASPTQNSEGNHLLGPRTSPPAAAQQASAHSDSPSAALPYI